MVRTSDSRRKRGGRAVETSLNGRFRTVPLDRLKPAVLNDKIYRPVEPDDPATRSLVRRMRRLGWLGAMAVTTDWVIVSGHRRRVAARLAGITHVDVEVLPIASTDPDFAEYLVAYNEQRKKTPQEEIREAIAETDPADSYARLIAHRMAESGRVGDRASDAGLCILTPAAARKRAVISKAKRPMLDAVVGVIDRYRGIWPLTLRQVHYRLLPLRVPRNAARSESTYVNDRPSYQDLSKLLVRARLAGAVPFAAIEDETRPRTTWEAWDGTGPFVREHIDALFTGYRRDLQRSQPAHVLLFVEKMTVQAIAERAAMPFHVPICVGRGYPSVTAVHEMAGQFRRSGKDRSVLLVASDFDPEGENIPDRLAASLRDEFGISNLVAAKVALTPGQVRELNLPPVLEVKDGSSRAGGFVARHGRAVYELEAVEPDALQRIIADAIEGVLDMRQFRDECRREAEDAGELEARRRQALRAIGAG